MAQKKKRTWYPVNNLGVACTALYISVPFYIIYTQSINSFSDELFMPTLAGMLLILACMLVSRYADFKPFHKKPIK